MKRRLTIKTKLYLEDLKKFLEISNISKINTNHAELIEEYIQRYREPEIFRDLLKDLLDFNYVIKSVINNMGIVYREITKFKEYNANPFKEIILNLNMLLDKDDLTLKDKNRIFDLISDYNKVLEDNLKGNNDLRNLLYDGNTITLSILTYAFYKALGGKNGEEILKNATSKLLTNIKFVDGIRII